MYIKLSNPKNLKQHIVQSQNTKNNAMFTKIILVSDFQSLPLLKKEMQLIKPVIVK